MSYTNGPQIGFCMKLMREKNDTIMNSFKRTTNITISTFEDEDYIGGLSSTLALNMDKS